MERWFLNLKLRLSNWVVGGVSDLVTTQFGFHIIKVTEKQAAHTQSLQERKTSSARRWFRKRRSKWRRIWLTKPLTPPK
jgi:hypothetical protein